jgi:hypothetical protein
LVTAGIAAALAAAERRVVVSNAVIIVAVYVAIMAVLTWLIEAHLTRVIQRRARSADPFVQAARRLAGQMPGAGRGADHPEPPQVGADCAASVRLSGNCFGGSITAEACCVDRADMVYGGDTIL